VSHLLDRFTSLPGYALGAIIVLVLYGLQSEIRFGARARTMHAGKSDRMSTWLLAGCTAVPILGFVLAVKAKSPSFAPFLPAWFADAVFPGMPAIAWAGVIAGACGLALRMWAVLALRERYTRTLLVHEQHAVERGGPYRWVRHPGYLGSLLCLNGIALASGNMFTFAASLIATSTAYAWRIKVEDEMLVAAFGEPYQRYCRETRALLPMPPQKNRMAEP
jgi:protein-S-isoprenylcysteine O-methyltransferase